MQDENAIEAQQSPRPIRTSSLVKNKSETPAEGMPPQKTAKLTHMPSAQLLESTALHTITNLPRAHSRTYPAPGSGKGKQAQEQKKPQAKSLMASSTGHPSQPTQPSPDSQSSPRQHLDEEISVSEQDLGALRALEAALEAVKQSVAQLLRESAQEVTALEETRRTFQKEQDIRAKHDEQEQLELEKLNEQLESISPEHADLEDEIFDLQVESEEKKREVENLEEKLDLYENETSRELLDPPLQRKKAETVRLQELIGEQMALMEKTAECWTKLHGEDVDAYYALATEVREREFRVANLRSELELEDMNMDLEATLGMSIEEEFEVLKSRHSVPKGSDFDKKLIARQAELKARYDREYASEKKLHSAALDQINLRTLSHSARLAEFQRAIKRAKSSIEESKRAFEQAEQGVLQVRAEKDARLREISEAAKLLAALS
ncbi:hypothetical protein KVV02_000555 [Mortierella alpina]|uniref:Uncharacterized protein n=1 Tax=Mortierella alpina TaxID=64518 RepID=A0A9P8A269_MORAP|nr:hypothetical protein KVV02_000555 [Mortierella alpina]